MANDSEMDEVLIDLAEAYPDWRPPSVQATFNQYKNSLRAYSKETLQHAARRCIDSCLFFPKIAEIRKAIYELRATESNPNLPDYKDMIFVPPPPEFHAAMDTLFKKWGLPRRPRPLPHLPDVEARLPYKD